jgi:hypothetical protein
MSAKVSSIATVHGGVSYSMTEACKHITQADQDSPSSSNQSRIFRPCHDRIDEYTASPSQAGSQCAYKR